VGKEVPGADRGCSQRGHHSHRFRRPRRRPYSFRPRQGLFGTLPIPLGVCGEGGQEHRPLLPGKLGRQGRLNAVIPGSLVHLVDQLSNRHFLVDTGAGYSIFPHQSSSPPSGPCLRGAAGQLIPCWGEKIFILLLHGCRFTWNFLLATVSFHIIGVDFLRHFQLMVDPAANMVADKASLQ
jgi:hypothetical protein